MARAKSPGLLRALEHMLRKVGAQSVLISDLVARRVGLNSTDLECLDLLVLAGPTTAGQLAAHTGLTTGATTAVIDRLERAGLVRRHRVPDDRRRVLVEAVPARLRHVEALYEPLAASMAQLNAEFDERQLETVLSYMSRALEAGADHVRWLQARPIRRPRTGGTVRESVGRGRALVRTTHPR